MEKRKFDVLTPTNTPRKHKTFRYAGSSPRKSATKTRKRRVSDQKIAIEVCCRRLQNNCYRPALRALLRGSASASKAFKLVYAEQIRKDISAYLKKDNLVITQNCSMENMVKFQWRDLYSELRVNLPFLLNAIIKGLTSKSTENKISIDEKFIIQTYCNVMAMILAKRSPKVKFLQGINGIQLWRCGAQRKLFHQYNIIGSTCSSNTTLRNLSSIKTVCNQRLLTMKAAVENLRANELPPIMEEEPDAMEDSSATESASREEMTESLEVMSDYNSDKSSVSSLQTDDDEFLVDIPDVVDESQDRNGYTVVWDNVGKIMKARHQKIGKENPIHLWALSYCAKNRVKSAHLQNEGHCQASEIPLEKYFANNADVKIIKSRMSHIVQNHLASYVPIFMHLKAQVDKHQQHRFFKENSEKSEVINLGVYADNPSSTNGVINILADLQQHVPVLNQEECKLMPLVCFGDGLSCERHNDAHLARSNGATMTDRLQGLQPSPQEFHKRMLLMQDAMDLFFAGSSGQEKGTMFYLKNVFEYKNVTQDLTSTFNYASDFLHFITAGYSVLAAMQILNIQELNEGTASDFRPNLATLQRTADSIVNLIWKEQAVGQTINPPDEDVYIFCICKEDTGDEMVQCSRKKKCKNGEWFHFLCVGIEEAPEGVWYCSETCNPRKQAYPYCTCKQKSRETLVKCENTKCARGQKFHLSCVDLREAPAGAWFCSNLCKDASGRIEDFKFNYVTSLLYFGLLDAANRDAVREGDGELMMAFWRLNLPMFHNGNHIKYVILQHRLMSGINGWLPERLGFDMVHNRTVNVAGGPGRNLAMDLVNEFLNNRFKESLRNASGNISSETVERHSKVIGHLTILDVLYDIDSNISKSYRHDHTSDIEMLTDLLRGQDLFKRIPGREYKAFPQFVWDGQVKQPKKLHDSLIKHSKKLDRLRRVTKM